MKSARCLSLVLFVLAILPAACSPAASAPTASAPTLGVLFPGPTATMEPTAVPLSFTPATYKDEANGFELDYPSGWTASPSNVIGSRGSTAQLFSPGTSAEALAAGGSRVGITVYLWDPKSDLAAYVAHRRDAWDSGGYSIVRESAGELAAARKYASFVVQSPEKEQAFFLVTTIGEKYLEISGEGDLALAEEIALTMRPLGSNP